MALYMYLDRLAEFELLDRLIHRSIPYVICHSDILWGFRNPVRKGSMGIKHVLNL